MKMKHTKLSIIATYCGVILCSVVLISCSSKKETKQKAEPVIPVKISSASSSTEKNSKQQTWTEVPALKDEYTKYFDYFGFAVPETQLTNDSIMKGVSYQANCFTCENECKPDFIFNWAQPQKTVAFKAEDGKEYQVPEKLLGFTRLAKILDIAKQYGMIMRGHVLVWHSQTPAWFFREDYSTSKPYADKATMTARQEWYIKSADLQSAPFGHSGTCPIYFTLLIVSRWRESNPRP